MTVIYIHYFNNIINSYKLINYILLLNLDSRVVNTRKGDNKWESKNSVLQLKCFKKMV